MRASAPLMVLSAGALWGLIGVFTRNLYSVGFSPVNVAMLRCAITAVCMLALLLVADRNGLRIRPGDIWMFLGTGIASIVMFNVLYFTATDMLSLSLAAVLLYTAPCFVLIMSAILFKERLTKRKILALIIAFLGCAACSGLFGGVGGITATGLLCGIGAGFGYALYSVFGKFALAKYSSYTVTFYTFAIAALALVPFNLDIVSVSTGGTGPILWALGLGILITLVPYVLYTKGLSGMNAGKASIIAFIEPLVATIAGFAVFGEHIGLVVAIGIAMMFASLVLINTDTNE